MKRIFLFPVLAATLFACAGLLEADTKSNPKLGPPLIVTPTGDVIQRWDGQKVEVTDPDDLVALQAKPAPKAHGRGYKPPSKEVLAAMHRISELKHGHIRKTIPVATATVYDARTLGVVPPVGNQGQCGDCYMWSGCKVCSSAQMVAKVVPQDGKFMLAPSYGLDCHSELGGCNGGDEYQVAQLIQSGGWPSLAQYGGDGQNPGKCSLTSAMTLYTVSSVIMVGPNSGVAATQDIKNYLAVYGYVSVAADASTDWWNNGTGTDTDTGSSIDHAIGIVGWDDTHDNGDGTKGAWIMQNNWDVTWGTNCANTANPTPTEPGGYGWVKYGASSLGYEAFVTMVTPATPPSPTPPTPPGPTPPNPPVPPTPAPITFTIPQQSVVFTGFRSGYVPAYTVTLPNGNTAFLPTCGTGSCGTAAGYRWVIDTDGEAALFQGSKQVGACIVATGKFRPLDGDKWGPVGQSPCPLPTAASSLPFGTDLFGTSGCSTGACSNGSCSTTPTRGFFRR
jgi:C1A family cysteine protease